MAKTREQKEVILKELQDAASGSESVVFVGFHGLPVANATEMRRELSDKGVSYFVAKKSLIRRAFSDSGISGDIPELPGEVAVAYGSDPVVPASSINAFAKKYKEKITILGGVFEKRFMDKAEMSDIATIPPLEVLYGQFVGLINSPIARFVVSLNEIAKKREARA